MRQFNVIVKTQFFGRNTHAFVPFFASIFPVTVPFHLRAWANKKLHFHLFKFPHAENELTGNNLVTESLSCLRNAERNFHPAAFLHIQEIYKNTLGRFWA